MANDAAPLPFPTLVQQSRRRFPEAVVPCLTTGFTSSSPIATTRTIPIVRRSPVRERAKRTLMRA